MACIWHVDGKYFIVLSPQIIDLRLLWFKHLGDGLQLDDERGGFPGGFYDECWFLPIDASEITAAANVLMCTNQ